MPTGLNFRLPKPNRPAMLSQVLESECNLDALLPRQNEEESRELLAAAVEWSWAVWAEAERLGNLPLSGEQMTQGLELSQNPVYICGAYHSGTTVIRNFLTGQPGLVVLPSKSAWFANIEFRLRMLPEDEQLAFLCTEWLRRLATPDHESSYWMLGRSAPSSSPYVTFARYLMSWWKIAGQMDNEQWPHIAIVLAYATCTNNLSAKLWVDKTPTNERFLTRLWQEMPKAKVIHVIREPGAVINSRKIMEPAVAMQNALIELEMSFRIAFEVSQLQDPGYMLIRYEDICEDLPAVIKSLDSFLNIGITMVSDPPVARKVEMLSVLERQVVASFIGPIASKLNYPTARVSFLRKHFLRLKYALPLFI
jgi:hypothetical protein